nr:radical SAM protein [Ruminiclostridium hungatei]
MSNKEGYDHLRKKHPCFSGEAHFIHGRIHLPVSPICNIHCRFCKRSLNKTENRPGVACKVLTPDEALRTLEKALLLCPELTVAGIAGPGDALATTDALETFELIEKKYPELIKCLSTNGLMLSENARRIADTGIKTISVTVNAVEPEILEKICSGIYYKNEYITGRKAAEILIAKQLEGIRTISRLEVLVKINTVLIPDINLSHIEEIARVTSEAGAAMMNIIPLIPQNEMSSHKAPDCTELNNARVSAEKYLQVFRHCKQCRADACGIPGRPGDLSELLYDQPLETFSHG